MIAPEWNELLDLIHALVEGELCEADADRLRTWLAVDEEAQQVYVRAMQLHAELAWTFGSPGVAASSEYEFASVNAAPSCEPVDVQPPANENMAILRQCRRSAAFSMISMAASVVVLLMVFVVGGAAELLFVNLWLPAKSSVANGQGGLLRSDDGLHAGANRDKGTRRVGSSGLPGMALSNVLLFPLPALEDIDRVESAELAWTYKARDGKPTFSVDLYGLGFVDGGEFRGQGFWEGQLDASLRSAYGMQGSRRRQVALIARGAMTPDSETGRIVVDSPGLTSFLRSLYADGAGEGDLAVFRLNADVSTAELPRATGYAVVHPPVRPGKTDPSELPTLYLRAARSLPQSALMAEAVLSANSVMEHWCGGLVRSDSPMILTGGAEGFGSRRVGSSTLAGVGLNNVLVFHLPSRDALERVQFAQLEWTLDTIEGAPDFSVDLYGLGFVDSRSLGSLEYWEGLADSSMRSEYGMAGRVDRPVQLVARGVMTPHSTCGRVIVENEALAKFLQSLYDDGAQGGELVVFRLNADRSTTNISRGTGYRVVHGPALAGRTLPDDVPVLRVTAH